MSAAAEEKKEAATSSSPPASGGGSKIVLIITGLNMVATLAMVAILFISFQREKKRASVEDISLKTEEPAGGEKEGGEHGEAKEGGEHGEKAAPKKKNTDAGRMVTLDQFTVNLSTPGSVNPKFVRVNMSLQVPTEDIESEVTAKMPQVRNAVIDLINSKRPGDLGTAEGRDYLKDEIKTALNSFMVAGKVQNVFFTNFSLSP
jgi:flagellar FliL protein